MAARATNAALGEELKRTVAKAAEYYATLGYASFAPGNADGGLTTIEEKSLGAYAKSGQSKIDGIVKPGIEPAARRPVSARRRARRRGPLRLSQHQRQRGNRRTHRLRIARDPVLDGPRLGRRLRDRARDQGVRQSRDVAAHGRRHGRRRGTHPRRAARRCPRSGARSSIWSAASPMASTTQIRNARPPGIHPDLQEFRAARAGVPARPVKQRLRPRNAMSRAGSLGALTAAFTCSRSAPSAASRSTPWRLPRPARAADWSSPSISPRNAANPARRCRPRRRRRNARRWLDATPRGPRARASAGRYGRAQALYVFFVDLGLAPRVHGLSADGEIAVSFMHGINLVFHEAGHVVFMSFGHFLHVAGGTLGQWLMPVDRRYRAALEESRQFRRVAGAVVAGRELHGRRALRLRRRRSGAAAARRRNRRGQRPRLDHHAGRHRVAFARASASAGCCM